MNLILVLVLENKGYMIKFLSWKTYIKKGNIFINGAKVDNMYLLKVDNKVSISNFNFRLFMYI
jgi:hypothetical protein